MYRFRSKLSHPDCRLRVQTITFLVHTFTPSICICRPSPFWSLLSHPVYKLWLQAITFLVHTSIPSLRVVCADHHLSVTFTLIYLYVQTITSLVHTFTPICLYVQTITFLVLSLLSICMCKPSPFWSILSRLSICMCRPSPLCSLLSHPVYKLWLQIVISLVHTFTPIYNNLYAQTIPFMINTPFTCYADLE